FHQDWINEAAGAYLFPGYLPIVLAAVGVLWPRSVAEKCEHAPSRPAPPAKNGPNSRAVPREARLPGAREALVRRAASARRSATSQRRVTGFYVLLTLIGVWLSVGPPVGLWPFVYWLPGFNLIRVPSRFMLLAVLGLAVLAGLGFDRLTQRLSLVRASAVAAIVVLLLVGEFAAIPFEAESYRIEIPAIDRWLA